MTVLEYNQALKRLSQLMSESNPQEKQESELEKILDAIDNFSDIDFTKIKSN